MATIPASEPHSVAGMHTDSILLAEVLLDLAERAQAYTNAAGVAIALIRSKDLFVRTSTGTAPEVGTTIPLADGFISECLRTRKPLACRDIDSDSRVGPVLRALKVRSLMAIPVCEVRDVRGMMLVIAPLPTSFQPTHISILMTLSDIIAAKLREHETAAEVEIQLFDDPEQVPEFAAEPPVDLCPIDTTMSFDAEPACAPPAPAAVVTPPAPSIFEPSIVWPPAAAVAPPLAAAPTPAILEVVPAPTPAMVKPPVVAAPVPSIFEMPAMPQPSAVEFEPPVVAPPAPVVTKPPVVTSSVIEPPVPFAVKAPPVTPPAPAAAKPPVPPPAPPVVPALGSPALPMTPALAMMEEKIELGERDPGLLTPSEDPRRFKRNRTFVATTIKPSVPTTTATTIPRPAALTSLHVVEPAKLTPSESAYLSTPAPAIVSLPIPALNSWETPRENQAKRPWMVPVFAIAAVLVIAVGFWIHYSTSKDVPAPVIPVPSAAAAALPSAAPAPPTPTATSQPVAKPATESAKTTKAAETKAPPPEPKHEAPQVIEIAAGQAKPAQEPEPDVPAPKLDLPARDPGIGNLSRVSVAMPVAPKSDLVPASLVSRVNPAYPYMARQLGISGVVIMSVTIAKDGSVGKVHATAGAIQLRQAAADAVKQWRYKPATLNGQPIESSAEVKVNFTK